MGYPDGKNKYFRHLLFFAFHRGQKAAGQTAKMFFAFLRGQNAAGAAWEICNAYGEGVIAESTTGKWFAKLRFASHTEKVLLPSLQQVNGLQSIRMAILT
ncbi:unnamed protein product [Strongylus vulgaris]|uniref:Mos1 transposase HTH domain-containing protein n=1 Tax=Strongylus vulgaris TaxID=40348 RepID=A0A3P7LI28_STRVU|nr:unnamed protein product [Strongylus vulgaris]